MSDEFEFETFRVNKQLCEFSANGKFLAVAYQKTLTIRNVSNYSVFHSFVFSDTIEFIEWAPNDCYIICANFTNAAVQIFSLLNPDWKYKLVVGSCGLESVTWSPDSKNILTTSDFKVQITVWSLQNEDVVYITKLKSTQYNSVFSPNGKFFAVIISEDGKECVDLYKTQGWKLSRKLLCDKLLSIDGISWSPNSELLCIWSSISGVSKLVVYSRIAENHIGIFNADENNCLENDDLKLRGIEKVSWMPSGQILAVAGHNEVVVLLNYLTWNQIGQLTLQPVLKENTHLSKVYKETVIKVKDPKNGNFFEKHKLEEITYGSINVPIAKKNLNQPSLSTIDIFEFSCCGRYLIVHHQIYPKVLWIWHIPSDIVDLFFMENEISAVKWDLKRPLLFIFTESSYIFQWTPDDASCIAVPNGSNVLDARCHPSSEIILLCGYNKAFIHNIENQQN